MQLLLRLGEPRVLGKYSEVKMLRFRVSGNMRLPGNPKLQPLVQSVRDKVVPPS